MDKTLEQNLMTLTLKCITRYMISRKKLINISSLLYRVGTTKTTSHIPGYNGFIPRTDINPVAVEHGSG